MCVLVLLLPFKRFRKIMAELSKNKRILLSLLTIEIVAIIGDTLVHSYTFPIFPLVFKCLTDSAIHFGIAALSWCVVENVLPKQRLNVTAILFCGVIASLIDVDHFITAGSFWLQVFGINSSEFILTNINYLSFL